MKKIFFLSIFISLFGSLLGGNIQAAVLSPKLFLNEKSGFEVSDEETESLATSVGGLVELNTNIVENSLSNVPAKTDPKWKVSGYVTSIGVTSGGVLGILGFKGTAMAEIYWAKRKVDTFLRRELIETEPADMFLSDLSEPGINDGLEHLMAIVKGSKKVENLETARVGLKQKLNEFARVVREARSDQSKPWYLSGVRLDLSVSASGAIAPIYTVGAALSLRVVWVPVRAKTAAPIVSGATGNPLLKMVEDLTVVLGEMSGNQALEEKGLSLKTVRFGLGVTVAGQVFFGKGDGSLVFSVLMNKNPNYIAPQNPPSIEMKNSALLVESNSELKLMDWAIFKKGIEKALKLSRSFITKNVDQEKEKTRKWEVNAIKTSYSVNLTAGVGLVTVGEVAQLQMTYKKN